VDDASAFMEEACNLCKDTNAAARSAQKNRGDIKHEEIKIGDRPAHLITFTDKRDAGTGDHQLVLLTAIDKQTVLLSGLPDRSQAETVVNRYLKESDRSLGTNAIMRETRALLPEQVQAAAFLNLEGTGLLHMLGGSERGHKMPPLGFSLRTFPSGLETQTVLPFDTLRALVDAARSGKDTN